MKRASIRQVAARAGVSPKTVTNVMRGRDAQSSPATRERVLEAVRALNYVPVHVGVQNRRVETHIVSLVFDHTGLTIDDQEWDFLDQRAFNGARLGALRHNYDVLLNQRGRSAWVKEREEVWLLDRRSDGFLFINPRDPDETYRLMESLSKNGIPSAVCFSDRAPDGAASVLSDNIEAMRLVVDHCVSQGHRKIAHLAGPSFHAEAPIRVEGYLKAMARHGLESETLVIDTGVDGSRSFDAAEELIARVKNGEVTAAVCWDDGLACMTWRTAVAAGLDVPRDLSLTGMNGNEDRTDLTTCTNDAQAIGAAGVEALIGLIRGGSPAECSRLLPVQLIERGSVCPPVKGYKSRRAIRSDG